jgi:hypothetical protein
VLALQSIFPRINIFFPQQKTDTPFQLFFKKWMQILFWVVLILFSFIQTKIVHYSSLCYFPLTFLAAYSLLKIMNKEMNWKKWQHIISVTIAVFIGALFVLVPLIEKYKSALIETETIKDPFAIENLKANVQWGGWEWIIGIFWLGLILWWLFQLKRRTGNLQILILGFAATAVTTNMIMVAVVPRVEQYIQGVAIDFFQTKQNENCIIETFGYKSYAHYFYAAVSPLPDKDKVNHYVVSKITSEEKIKKECISCTELYRKNGFIFWEKK